MHNEIHELRNIIYDVIDVRCIRDNIPISIDTEYINIYLSKNKKYDISGKSITISHDNDLYFTKNMKYVKCTGMSLYNDLDNISFHWDNLPNIINTIDINNILIAKTFFKNINKLGQKIKVIKFNNVNLSIEWLNILIDKWPSIEIYYNGNNIQYEKIEI